MDQQAARHPGRPGAGEIPAIEMLPAFSLEDIDHFSEFTGDTFYAHTDPEAAAAETEVVRRVAADDEVWPRAGGHERSS